jgi:hypothetical protein
MYDRYSLGRALLSTGFRDVVERRADTSRITDWKRYLLDTDEHGQVYKPDSLFMEAVG